MQPDNPIERAYDTDQPFLDRVLAAVERTRQVRSPYIEHRADGAFRDGGAEWKRESVDTIGTKAKLHWEARTFQAAAQDAFAMNANDLYRDRALPYKLTNTLLIESEDEEAIAEIVESLADLSVARGIHITAGETPILNTQEGFELDMSMTGVVIDTWPNEYEAGDVIIGIPSSGIHSNGLTDARRLFGESWPRELLEPTRIYDEIPHLLRSTEVHGLTHVTGGAFTKARTEGLDIVIEKTHLESSSGVFFALRDRWMAEMKDTYAVDVQMHRKFNNGIGFMVGVPRWALPKALEILEDGEVVGIATAGSGEVRVDSLYTGRTLTL